jgi:hypothetical protein
MRNAYGRKLRQLITSGYSVDASIEMHDVDAFADDVSAYPAVTVISKREQMSPLVTSADSSFGPAAALTLVAWADEHPAQGSSTVLGSGTRLARLEGWFDGDGSSWPTGSPDRLVALRDLEARFQPIERGRTRVGIGVATGADDVFVTTDSRIVEAERMVPLSMTRDTGTGRFEWSGHYLINPWEGPGRLVDLDSYPRLRSYFEKHSDALMNRHVAGKKPRQWYRTIDPVHVDLTARSKLLFPDMKMTSSPVLEQGGFYPHHNLYYVVSEDWDLEVLGGLLLSRIAQFFIESYAVRMRGGTLRFQAQYLRRIRTPDPGDLTEYQSASLRAAFRDRDAKRATATALSVYGLSHLPE